MPAHTIFFPAAAFYAAIAVPSWLAAMLGVGPAIPGLAFPAGHAHEMIFGFALAAVAGNQLGPTRRGLLALLVTMWAAGRVTFLACPASLAAAAANGAFAAVLAWQFVPRLTAPIRKLRNRALPATVAALCAAAVVMQATLHAGSPRLAEKTLLAAVLLLALLMLFMGGRIIAPAAAGEAYRQGENLAARVQPRIESALIVALFAAIGALAADASVVAAAALFVAAAVAAVRLVRWRLWRLAGRRDIACLAAGLAAVALALFTAARPVAAIHLITVGAMGTLTISVMSLTYARLARRAPSRQAVPAWGAALIAVATAARLGADWDAAAARALLATAAACWSAAYLALFVSFFRMRKPAR